MEENMSTDDAKHLTNVNVVNVNLVLYQPKRINNVSIKDQLRVVNFPTLKQLQDINLSTIVMMLSYIAYI